MEITSAIKELGYVKLSNLKVRFVPRRKIYRDMALPLVSGRNAMTKIILSSRKYISFPRLPRNPNHLLVIVSKSWRQKAVLFIEIELNIPIFYLDSTRQMPRYRDMWESSRKK